MNILHVVNAPSPGTLALSNDDGLLRLIDPNGKRYRVKPEAGTPVLSTRAFQTFLFTDRPTDGVEFSIGGVTYTWRTSVTLPNEVKIGASTTAHDILAYIAAINASASTTLYGAGTVANPFFSAAAGAGDTVVITALSAGPTSAPDYDQYTLFGAFDELTNGTHATEARAGDQMFDDSYLWTAVSNVTKTSETGWRKSALA